MRGGRQVPLGASAPAQEGVGGVLWHTQRVPFFPWRERAEQFAARARELRGRARRMVACAARTPRPPSSARTRTCPLPPAQAAWGAAWFATAAAPRRARAAAACGGFLLSLPHAG